MCGVISARCRCQRSPLQTQRDDANESHLKRHQSEFHGIVTGDNKNGIFMQIFAAIKNARNWISKSWLRASPTEMIQIISKAADWQGRRRKKIELKLIKSSILTLICGSDSWAADRFAQNDLMIYSSARVARFIDFYPSHCRVAFRSSLMQEWQHLNAHKEINERNRSNIQIRLLSIVAQDKARDRLLNGAQRAKLNLNTIFHWNCIIFTALFSRRDYCCVSSLRLMMFSSPLSRAFFW